MTDKRIILTSAGSRQEAHTIARALVENGLAACVNILPHVESIYRWKGEVEEAEEWMLLVKTSGNEEVMEAVRSTIKQNHSYELPECIAVNIESGCGKYLQWMDESLKK